MPILPFELPDDGAPPFGIPIHDFGTAADAVDRLVQQYKQPKIEALINALATPTQDLEDAIFQIYELRWIGTASGAQLDNLGAIVGQLRQGFDDATYRLLIQSRIMVNRSSGGPEELYNIFKSLLPGGVTMRLVYYVPAAFLLIFSGALTVQLAGVFAQLLHDARAAGVGGQGVWSLYDPPVTFTLDGTSAQALDNGHLAEAFA